MKFDEWYNSYKILGIDKRTAKQVWDACKYECIKLVKRECKFFHYDVVNTNEHLENRLEKEI